MKKACETNRERIANGLEPIFIQEAPKLIRTDRAN